MLWSVVQQGVLERTLPSGVVGAVTFVLWSISLDYGETSCVSGDELEGSRLRPLFSECENVFGGTMWGTVGSWRPWLVALILGGVTLGVTLVILSIFPKSGKFLAPE